MEANRGIPSETVDAAPRPTEGWGLPEARPVAPPRQVAALLILVLGLGATAAVAIHLIRTAHQADRLRFENMALEVENRFRARVDRHFTALLGGAALFGLGDRVTADDFAAYVERLQASGGLQGVTGLGFCRRVRPAERSVFEAMEPAAGRSASIWPPGERAEYFAVQNLDPAVPENLAQIGFDLATVPAQRRAMERARDTGEPAASGKILLAAAGGRGAARPAFVVFVPVYRGGSIPKTVVDRRTHLLGHVFSPFVGDALLDNLVPRQFLRAVTFSLFDGPLATPDALLYAAARAGTSRLSQERMLSLGAHDFVLRLQSLPGFESTFTPRGILVGPCLMLAVTLLLSAFARGQTRARHQAEASARRLREAREEALTHLRARDAFLSIASHELKTPLTALQLHVDGLLRGADAGAAGPLADRERLSRRLESVSRQSRRLGALVNELLDVSRVTGGLLELHPEDFDLVELVQEVRTRFEPEASRVGCAVVLDVETDGRPLVGHWDRLRVEQVVLNLLSNAVKYAPGKPIEIRLVGRDDTALMRVTDHGMGIDPKDHDRIFERFERAVPDRKFGGFGIGLWITKRIVEAMDGRIGVISRLDEGATFEVELPMRARRRATFLS